MFVRIMFQLKQLNMIISCLEKLPSSVNNRLAAKLEFENTTGADDQ